MSAESYLHWLQENFKRLESPEELGRREAVGEWPYVPYSISSFMEALGEARRAFLSIHGKAAESFLEVGCGYGWLTSYAQSTMLSWRRAGMVHGLEIHPPYVEFARTICVPDSIIQADALAFKRYRDYDLIFFYMPFREPQKQKQLVERIMAQAKGLVFFPAYGVNGTAIYNPEARVAGGCHLWSAKLKGPAKPAYKPVATKKKRQRAAA